MPLRPTPDRAKADTEVELSDDCEESHRTPSQPSEEEEEEEQGLLSATELEQSHRFRVASEFDMPE